MKGEGEAGREERFPTGEEREILRTLNTVNTTILYTFLAFCLFVLPRMGSLNSGDPNPITFTVARGIEEEERNPMITAIRGRFRLLCEG